MSRARDACAYLIMNLDNFSTGYMQPAESQPLQPLQPLPYYRYRFAQTSPTTSSSYEMTAGGGGAGGAGGGPSDPRPPPPPPPLPPQPLPASLPEHQHEPRKRKPSPQCASGSSSQQTLTSAMAGCDPAAAAMPSPVSRKRKTSSFGAASSSVDDDDAEEARSVRSLPDRKQNHSEIEKRRRDKMNTYISELAGIVPMCGAMARKLDKLTVLRMAVQHMRNVRSAMVATPLARPGPQLVSERELNALVEHAAQDAGAVVLVVGCDRGRLLFLSASVTDVLHYERAELVGQSMFDILHPKDVAKVKEQLSSPDLGPRERFIDAKTMLPVRAEGAGAASASRLCPGARRSFFCRIRCKSPPSSAKRDPQPAARAAAKLRKKPSEKRYCVMQCTGYLKTWLPAEAGAAEGSEDDAGVPCLVAVARALTLAQPPLGADAAGSGPPSRILQFTSRHSIDGKYLFVDQRVVPVLGFLPQELVGTSLYELVHGGGEALRAVAAAHRAALVQREERDTPPYAVRRKDGSAVRLQTCFKPFRNPWTKDVDYMMAQNTLMPNAQAPTEAYAYGAGDVQHDEALASAAAVDGDADVQRLIEARVEAHKIGCAIAEEVMRRSPVEFSPELPPELPPDLLSDVFDPQALMDNILGDDALHSVKNNVPLSAAGVRSPAAAAEEAEGGAGGVGSPAFTLPASVLDGNGEAAMAVIMSLLEADAGLGGSVNFTGLPWPLP